MKKKVIRNTIIALLIPIIITIIIWVMYGKKLDNVFYDPINYETNNNTIITDNYNTAYTNRYYSNDFININPFVSSLNKNYNLYLYIAIATLIVFFIISSYIAKNKKW